jgi:hypothetical protein
MIRHLLAPCVLSGRALTRLPLATFCRAFGAQTRQTEALPELKGHHTNTSCFNCISNNNCIALSPRFMNLEALA